MRRYRFADSLAAYSIASSRLASLAVPLPAWSKAVPWSTLVRMIGNPSDTLMPFTLVHFPLAASYVNPLHFTGMWPWSWYIATHTSYAPLTALAKNVSGGWGP